MNKFTALALAATALIAQPAMAQSPGAKAAPLAAPAPTFKIEDLGCTIRLSMTRNLLMKRAADPAHTPEQRTRLSGSTIAADRALAYYFGRLSMGANDPYRGRRGEAIFNAMKAAPRDKTAGESLACMTNADNQLKALQDTLKP